MDNAQKAIMIGVGLFITIVIITAVLLITNLATGMIDNAKDKIASISDTLSNQVYNAYDGKVLTGSELKIAYDQYSQTDIGLIFYKSGNTTPIGKAGGIDIIEATPPATYTRGGITITTYATLANNDTLADILSNGDIDDYTKVYSSVVKDGDTGKTIGILFVSQ